MTAVSGAAAGREAFNAEKRPQIGFPDSRAEIVNPIL